MTLKSRTRWRWCLAGIIASGMLSRAVHTGLVIFDKYLGDALYAAMVYVILRLTWRTTAVAIPAMIVMTLIEVFQLTMIPARLAGSEHLIVRIVARLLGTEFSLWDLVAYGVGIGTVYMMDSSRSKP